MGEGEKCEEGEKPEQNVTLDDAHSLEDRRAYICYVFPAWVPLHYAALSDPYPMPEHSGSKDHVKT